MAKKPTRTELTQIIVNQLDISTDSVETLCDAFEALAKLPIAASDHTMVEEAHHRVCCAARDLAQLVCSLNALLRRIDVQAQIDAAQAKLPGVP